MKDHIHDRERELMDEYYTLGVVGPTTLVAEPVKATASLKADSGTSLCPM